MEVPFIKIGRFAPPLGAEGRSLPFFGLLGAGPLGFQPPKGYRLRLAPATLSGASKRQRLQTLAYADPDPPPMR